MLGEQQGLEMIIAYHGPTLHPGTSFFPFVLSSSSLYLLFSAETHFFVFCPWWTLWTHSCVPLYGCTWSHTVCFVFSTRNESNSYNCCSHILFCCHFLLPCLDSPVAPCLSSGTNLSYCSNGSLLMMRWEVGLSLLSLQGVGVAAFPTSPKNCSSSTSSRTLLQMLQPMVLPTQLPSFHL